MTAYEEMQRAALAKLLDMQRRIEELEKQQESSISIEEQSRRCRWHATYNAVRGGFEASCHEDTPDIEFAHKYCAEVADRAHGPLKPEGGAS